MVKHKRPSKRALTLAAMRVAGYHEDTAEFTRLYIENRISYQVAQEEYEKGRRMRKSGVPCNCRVCKK